jgi:hypothetical protein
MSIAQRFLRRFGFQFVIILFFFVFLIPSLFLASVESLSEIQNWRGKFSELETVYKWSSEYAGDVADDMMFAFLPVVILVAMSLIGSYIILGILYDIFKGNTYSNFEK